MSFSFGLGLRLLFDYFLLIDFTFFYLVLFTLLEASVVVKISITMCKLARITLFTAIIFKVTTDLRLVAQFLLLLDMLRVQLWLIIVLLAIVIELVDCSALDILGIANHGSG